jgi:hypothetical protein
MTRCGCSGATCSCLVQGSGSISVSGTGSVASPYLISAALNLNVLDSGTVDMAITGDGSTGNPWVISANANLDLNALTDVDTAGAATGQVLAKQSDGTYRFVAATTAPTGAINLSSTGGLQGDGSAGSPLSVKLPAGSGLTLDSTGLRIAGTGAWTAYTPSLTASTTNPSLGNGTIAGAYSQVGKTISFGIDLRIGSTTTRGVGRWYLSLPVPPHARLQTCGLYMYVSGVAEYVGQAKIEGGKINNMQISTSTNSQALSHSVPASLTAGSPIILTGVYEAA